jgi:two-component system, sensor histidine kinase YesM
MKSKRSKVIEFFERYLLLKNRSFMTKLIVFASLLIIIPVSSVGIISYQYSAAELEEEVRQSSHQVIEQVESHIEYYLQDFEITSLQIINSPEVNQFLQMDSLENQHSQFIKESLRDYLETQEYSRADISNITVLSDHGLVIDTLGTENYYPASNMKEEYWYSAVPYQSRTMLVSRTVKLKDKEQPVISLVRRLYNPKTIEPVGMLVIDINFRRIEEIAKKVTVSKNGIFFILDAKGHYVYHPDFSKLGKKAERNLNANWPSEESGSMVLKNEQRDFITYTQSQNLGWTFFTAVSYWDLTEGIRHIGQAISWTIVISLLIAYLLGSGFATSLIRPIRRLQHFMKEVETGNLNGRVVVESKDEIGQLSASFNHLVCKLSHLIEEVYFSKLREIEMSLKQKEIELKMLQSQMNPHFLYNSLETIRGMALEENQEHIATMSSMLGKLLRYNLKNNSATVTLEEEMKFCEMYLQIQSFRFEDRFEHTWDIPQWARNLQVVKFSLQPIVENCYVHSIGCNVRKITINIAAFRSSKTSIVVQISDNGVGIPDNTVKEITKKMEQMTTSNNGMNIGIINVHQRIRNLFGSEYGVSIESNKGVGTTVKLHMPILEDESEGGLDEKDFVSRR